MEKNLKVLLLQEKKLVLNLENSLLPENITLNKNLQRLKKNNLKYGSKI